jgi:aryl-alcohol dehydrogenase-like predicted oxidoreductase
MFGYRTAPSAVLDRASRIAEVLAAHRLTLPPAAIAFPLTHPAVTGVVLDMRPAAEVRQNVSSRASTDTFLTAERWRFIGAQRRALVRT